MKSFAFVLLLLVSFMESNPECPSDIQCMSTLNRRSCPTGKYFRENVKSNNCCPDCVSLQDRNEECERNEDCAPGLKCRETTSGMTCKPDESQECDFYKITNLIWITTKYWEPDCLPNGRYASKQCKGEKLSGKCFCTNEEGMRIFGEAPWAEAENMTCACSRQVEILRKTRKDLSVHCDDLGNYEALQCNDGVCWCANERNGVPYTPVVPETMTRILPCFEENDFGSQYLRQCDSILVHTERTVKILKNHGLRTIILPKVNCNYDGSYARVQLMGTKQYCVYKNKQMISTPSEGKKDCNCMYDSFVAKFISEKEFNFACSDSGGYKELQGQGDTMFKVDSDGFMYEIVEND